MRSAHRFVLAAFAVVVLTARITGEAIEPEQPSVIGRWDLTVAAPRKSIHRGSKCSGLVTALLSDALLAEPAARGRFPELISLTTCSASRFRRNGSVVKRTYTSKAV